METNPKLFEKVFVREDPDVFAVTTNRDFVEWALSKNVHNRPIKKSVVATLAAEMRDGRWKLTAQGLTFAKDGTLLDGQHRLLANQQAGYPPIEISIAVGVDQSAQTIIDTHAKRSAADRLKLLLGVKMNICEAGAMKLLTIADRNPENPDFSCLVRVEDIEATMHVYDAEIKALPVRHCKGCSAAFWAAIWITAHRDGCVAEIEDFVQKVSSGANVEPRSPVITYRNRFCINSSKLGKFTQPIIYQTTMRLLRMHIKRIRNGLETMVALADTSLHEN